MNNELYSFALKTALTEIQNTYPGMKNSFIFAEDGEIIARNETTPEKTTICTVDSFDSILERAEVLGGIDNVTIECSKGRVNITNLNNFYFVTVASKDADKICINTITRVLIPTIFKTIEKISPTPLKNKSTTPNLEISTSEDIEQPVGELSAEKSETFTPTPFKPEPPVNQLIVENVGGLFASANTVRIGKEILAKWQDLVDNGEIEKVEIEAFNGKSVHCKVKLIKDAKQEGRGHIQVPQKIQSVLGIAKGELVKVKPILQMAEGQQNAQNEEE